MKKLSETEDIDPRILDRLRAYTALDNPIRLRAFRLIHDSPGLPFHEIAIVSSRRRHTILQGDWSSTCALPISCAAPPRCWARSEKGWHSRSAWSQPS